MKSLTVADTAALAIYCEAVADLAAARRALADPDQPVRPARQLYQQAKATLRQMATEFGLTPVARARLHVGETPEADDPQGMARWLQ